MLFRLWNRAKSHVSSKSFDEVRLIKSFIVRSGLNLTFKTADLPYDSRIIHAEPTDDGNIEIFYEYDPENENRCKSFAITLYTNDQRVYKSDRYIDSCKMPNGLVYHVYAR